jgi:hypothetical protein
MKLTFVNDFGSTFTVEIDSGMKLEDVMALLEAEARLFFAYLANPSLISYILQIACLITLNKKIGGPSQEYRCLIK